MKKKTIPAEKTASTTIRVYPESRKLINAQVSKLKKTDPDARAADVVERLLEDNSK